MKTCMPVNHRRWRTIASTLVCLGTIFSLADSVIAAKRPRLGAEISAGYTALHRHRWKLALGHFEHAIREFEQTSAVPEFKSSERSNSNLRRDLDLYVSSMAGAQALATFACLSAALAGEDPKAEEYLEKVEHMRSAMWGRSYNEYASLVQRRFFAIVHKSDSERYGKLLRYAGELLLDAGHPRGIALIAQARRLAPKDAEPPALLAAYFINHHRAGVARREARASLHVKPGQPRVLIDLATANWLLGHLESARSAAHRAASLDPSLPGPHATLAFVALQKSDYQTAVREAEEGQRLSGAHAFYATVLAACLIAAGDQPRAREVMKQAWPGALPGEKQLRDWFFRGRVLHYALLCC
ncbi:MAG TPA: hypothetical protein VJX67_06535 [Blastocatellia bacterium]|nr:hypothetical protein [Blastocatellia bacterium]